MQRRGEHEHVDERDDEAGGDAAVGIVKDEPLDEDHEDEISKDEDDEDQLRNEDQVDVHLLSEKPGEETRRGRTSRR